MCDEANKVLFNSFDGYNQVQLKADVNEKLFKCIFVLRKINNIAKVQRNKIKKAFSSEANR